MHQIWVSLHQIFLGGRWPTKLFAVAYVPYFTYLKRFFFIIRCFPKRDFASAPYFLGFSYQKRLICTKNRRFSWHNDNKGGVQLRPEILLTLHGLFWKPTLRTGQPGLGLGDWELELADLLILGLMNEQGSREETSRTSGSIMPTTAEDSAHCSREILVKGHGLNPPAFQEMVRNYGLSCKYREQVRGEKDIYQPCQVISAIQGGRAGRITEKTVVSCGKELC